STLPGGSALGQNDSPIRSPYQLGSILPPGLVGNAIFPAVQSSANQRRVIAATDALQPLAIQSISAPVLGPAMPSCFQRLPYCGHKRTGGSRYISSPSTTATVVADSSAGCPASISIRSSSVSGSRSIAAIVSESATPVAERSRASWKLTTA